MIKHDEMVKALLKSGDKIAEELTGAEANLWHLATGVSGEAGELLEAVYLYKVGYGELDRENVLEELGDMEFYMEGLRQALGVTRDNCYLAVEESDVEDAKGNTENLTMAAAAVGVIAGHILDLVKKCAVYRKPLDTENLTKKMGAMDVHLLAVRANWRVSFSRQECLEANIAKLGKRYEGLKYSDAAAQARADKADS